MTEERKLFLKDILLGIIIVTDIITIQRIGFTTLVIITTIGITMWFTSRWIVTAYTIPRWARNIYRRFK
jgi:hypothetical protein